ncbi:hypothetical protein JB92DRAFT_2836915 [Gautieria morchelliformis]|nr:hypothetical protein JB92DRAFT_2836915 [Gautieria morchelliformis]
MQECFAPKPDLGAAAGSSDRLLVHPENKGVTESQGQLGSIPCCRHPSLTPFDQSRVRVRTPGDPTPPHTAVDDPLPARSQGVSQIASPTDSNVRTCFTITHDPRGGYGQVMAMRVPPAPSTTARQSLHRGPGGGGCTGLSRIILALVMSISRASRGAIQDASNRKASSGVISERKTEIAQEPSRRKKCGVRIDPDADTMRGCSWQGFITLDNLDNGGFRQDDSRNILVPRIILYRPGAMHTRWPAAQCANSQISICQIFATAKAAAPTATMA